MKIALTSEGPDTYLQAGFSRVRVVKMVRGKYTSHRLSWKVGKRTFRRSYNDETAALAEAERVVKNLAASEGAATALNSEDAIYLMECRRKLGKIPMHVAVDFYLNCHEHTTKHPKTFSEVWDLFYQRCQSRKLSTRYYETLRHHRNFWEKAFSKQLIDTISNEEYLNFLSESPYTDRTKYNLFGSLAAVLRFGRKQRFLSQEHTEIEADFGKLRSKTPEFYTPDELCRLFVAHDKRYLPYIALMAFGGSRRAEAERLSMRDVLFDEKMIRMGPEITKTSTGRTLDIPDVLAQWLKEFASPGGKILPLSKIKAIPRKRQKVVGLETKQNALRHSFCSYHLALHRNAALTAELAGNSPQMLNRHYKALVSKIAAERWFSISPDAVRAFANENKLTHLLTW
jgi:integrase